MGASDLKPYQASAGEVADHLGVSRQTVYNWCKTTSIPHRQVGAILRFNLAEVDAWSARGDAPDTEAA